jgi:hypothetical protein
MGYSRDDPDIRKASNWLVENQLSDGQWRMIYVDGTKEDVCTKKWKEEREATMADLDRGSNPLEILQ